MKKLLAFLTIFSLVFAVAGCSTSAEKKEVENKSEEKTATELTDSIKTKMYNSVRIAELKVNEVFHKETAADGETPIMNQNFAENDKAVQFLSNYYSEDVAKSIYEHYATENKTAEGQMITNVEPYFAPSFLDTTIENVEFEGNDDKATIKTAENTTYHLQLKDNQYMITQIEK
ncbi:endonuclease [Bacillus sp. Bva_UNVM-123]|uniref:endonuclease n=1 Tax=Bacillus sp. Bva_UNVM-123 TaxID=2829798 RepID=UPI00391F10A5